MNFPSQHPRIIRTGDARQCRSGRHPRTRAHGLLGAVNAFRDQLPSHPRPITKTGAKLISISSQRFVHQVQLSDFQRFPEVDIQYGCGRRSDAAGIDGTVRLYHSGPPQCFQARATKLATPDKR